MRAFDQFLTPASYLQMGNWPFWIRNGLVVANSRERIFHSKLLAISVERRHSRTAGAGERRFA
jgi:hypothetical protein